MKIVKRTGKTTFDILNVGETQSSIHRSNSHVRISFVNKDGRLERYTKSAPSNLSQGCFLRASNSHLMGTGDERKCVAVLLAPFDTSTETKIIDGKTAKLLPVSFI